MAHPLCVVCEASGLATAADEVDHIIPLAKGGDEDSSNLQSLCREHHMQKTRRDNGWRGRPTIGVDGWPAG